MLTIQDKINFAKFIQNYPIEEFCVNYNISYDDAFTYLTVLEIPEDCKGCINLKWYKSYTPCTECKRACVDYYKRNQ
jgi:hypothetical protein